MSFEKKRYIYVYLKKDSNLSISCSQGKEHFLHTMNLSHTSVRSVCPSYNLSLFWFLLEVSIRNLGRKFVLWKSGNKINCHWLTDSSSEISWYYLVPRTIWTFPGCFLVEAWKHAWLSTAHSTRQIARNDTNDVGY